MLATMLCDKKKGDNIFTPVKLTLLFINFLPRNPEAKTKHED